MMMTFKRGLLVATVGLMLGCSNVAPTQSEGAIAPNAATTAALQQEAAPTGEQAESKDYSIQQYGGWYGRCRRRCSYWYPRWSYRWERCVRRCYGGGWGPWGGWGRWGGYGRY